VHRCCSLLPHLEPGWRGCPLPARCWLGQSRRDGHDRSPSGRPCTRAAMSRRNLSSYARCPSTSSADVDGSLCVMPCAADINGDGCTLTQVPMDAACGPSADGSGEKPTRTLGSPPVRTACVLVDRTRADEWAWQCLAQHTCAMVCDLRLEPWRAWELRRWLERRLQQRQINPRGDAHCLH
jgi:hypothetical protein